MELERQQQKLMLVIHLVISVHFVDQATENDTSKLSTVSLCSVLLHTNENRLVPQRISSDR